MRKADINIKGIIFNNSIQLLGYADDIDVIARSQGAVIEAFIAIEEQAKGVEDKTKYMLSIKNRTIDTV